MPWTEIEVQTGEGEEKIKIYMPATKKEAIEHMTNIETAEITFWPSAGITKDMIENQYSWAFEIVTPAQKTVKSLAFNPNNLGTAMLTPFAGGGGILPISTVAVDTLRNIAPTLVAKDEETNSGTLVAFSPGVWLYFFTEGRGIRYIELNEGGGGGPTPTAVTNQPSSPFNDYILSIDQVVFGVTDPATVLGVAVPFWWDDDLGSNQIGPLPILHSPIFDAVYALLRWLGADQFLARKTALAVTLYPAVSRKPVDIMQVYFSPYPTIMSAVLEVVNAITNGHPVQYAPIAFNLSPDVLSFTQADLDKLHELLTTEFDYRVSKLFDTHTYPVPLSYSSPGFLDKNSLDRPYLAIEKPLFEAYQKVLKNGSDVDATVATIRYNMVEGALSLFGLVEWLLCEYGTLGDICYNASALRNLNPPDDYLADFYAQACSSLRDTRGIEPEQGVCGRSNLTAHFQQKILPFLKKLVNQDSTFFEKWLTQRSSADVGTAMSDLFKEANNAGLIYYIPSTTVGYAKTSHVWLEGRMLAGVNGYLTIQFEATKTYLLEVFGKKFIETTDVKKQLEKGKALANAFAQALGLTNRFVIDTETKWTATLANNKEVTFKGPTGAIAELEDRYIIYAFVPFKNTCPFTNLLKFHWNEEQKAWEVIPLNPDDPTTVWDVEKEMQDTGCSALMLTTNELMARFGYTIADRTAEPQIAPIWAVAIIAVAVAGAYMAHAYLEGMKAMTQMFTLYTKTTLQIARYVHEGQEYTRDVSNNATTIAQSTANLVLYYCTKNPDSELCQDALRKYLDIAKQAQDINQQAEKDINRGNEILQHIYEVYSDNYRRTVEEMSKANQLFSLEGLKTLALYGLGFVVGIAVIPPLLTTVITNSLRSASRG